MFGTCCKETIVKNQEYYFYKGYGNQLQKRLPVRESQVNPLIEQTSQPFRLYLRSKEEELIKQVAEHNRIFVDKEFQPGSEALGKYTGRPVLWNRLSSLCQKVQKRQFDSTDLLSLKDGDSYFLSSLLALYQNIPLVQEIFFEDLEVNQTGAYKLRVSIQGRPQEMVIDDYLPVYRSNSQRTAFCHLDPSMIWVPLLQKAYAKIHGSYEKISMGFAHEVFVTFSLSPCIYQIIPTDFRREQQQKCWKTIFEAYQQHFPIVFGSRMKHTCTSVLPNQTYCLKNCKIVKQNSKLTKRVTLWQLPRPKPVQIENFVEYQKSGSAFSLPLVELMRNFEIIDVSHYRNNFSSHFYQFKSDPRSPVMYTFSITQNANVYLTLQRESSKKGRLRLILFHCQQTDYKYIQGRKEEVYSDITLRLDQLPVGNYLVVCQNTSLSNCIVRVYAPVSIPLQKVKCNFVNLLEKTFLQQGQNSKEDHQMLSQYHDDWYLSRALFQDISLGFFQVHLDEKSEMRCQIQIDWRQLALEGLKLLNKSDRVNYYNVVQKGSTDLLLFEYTGEELQAFTFPPQSMKIKMII